MANGKRSKGKGIRALLDIGETPNTSSVGPIGEIKCIGEVLNIPILEIKVSKPFSLGEFDDEKLMKNCRIHSYSWCGSTLNRSKRIKRED